MDQQTVEALLRRLVERVEESERRGVLLEGDLAQRRGTPDLRAMPLEHGAQLGRARGREARVGLFDSQSIARHR